jgi:hypothetical protein
MLYGHKVTGKFTGLEFLLATGTLEEMTDRVARCEKNMGSSSITREVVQQNADGSWPVKEEA